MYRKAIKTSLEYIRPLLTGKLFYENRRILNFISTLIILNEDGDILTTAGNANLFLMAEETNEVYNPLLREIKDSKEKDIKKIEKKYGILKDTIVGIHNMLIDVSSKPGKIDIIKHPSLDLAIIKINSETKVNNIKKFPVFSNKKIELGTSVCFNGFALPEYKTFIYDKDTCTIKTTNEIMNFPVFPCYGAVCRNIADEQGNITMFENSCEVVPGQNGGPVLDLDGNILGIMIGNKIIKSEFINEEFNLKLGIAINSASIIKFLKDNGIKFNEE